MTSEIYPMFLVDDYQDGGITEKAWVQVTAVTDTPAKVIDWLEKNASDAYDTDMRLVITGQSHHKPTGYAVSDTEDTRVVEELDKQPPCKECKGTGKFDGDDDEDACDECYGTGKQATFIFDSCEPIPWDPCESDHPEALHFWNVEVTDDQDAPTYPAVVSDEQEKMDI